MEVSKGVITSTKSAAIPIRVNPLWNYRCHSGFAVVEFGKDWPAFHCALKFEKSFEACLKFEKSFEAAGKGKRDYYNEDCTGSELYGWMAREDNYHLKNVVGDFLKKYGDLKTVSAVEADEKNKANMLLSNLSNVIEAKIMHLKEIEAKYSETSISLGNLITEKDKIHQAYNEELQKIQQNEHVQLQKILNRQAKMKFELQQREKELQIREAHNESERKKLTLEKQMHERATLEQKRADENVFRLAEDHKRSKEELHKRAIELEKQINSNEGLELEIECMRGSLSVMKHMECDGDSEFKQKIGDTEMALRQKEEELESFHTLVLEGVPIFGLNNRTTAYRFVTLVDVMYENKARLMCSAEGNPLELFERVVTIFDAQQMAPRTSSRSRKNDDFDLCVDNELGFAKDCTISRLTKMNSIEYLEQHAELLAEKWLPEGDNEKVVQA